MKKLFIAAIGVLMLASCTSDEWLGSVKDESTSKSIDGSIGFNMKVGNTTRTAPAGPTDDPLSGSHYEFGVFAAKDLNLFMQNNLVAWGQHHRYSGKHAGATTYGDPNSASEGFSTWFYEGLGSYNTTDYTMPEADQYLYYWDYGTENTAFYAYTPYARTHPMVDVPEYQTTNPDRIAFDRVNASFSYYNLSSFYTSPERYEVYEAPNWTYRPYQIATADTRAADNDPMYDAEMINYNEALYAYKSVQKTNYSHDVPLTFKHINAQVKIAFKHNIRGYKVKLIDMIPGDYIDPDARTAPKDPQNGVVLTPAKEEQTIAEMQAPKDQLPNYYEAVDLKVSGINATPVLSYFGSGRSNNNNLYFTEELTGYDQELYSGDPARTSLTTLYVIPNWDGTDYLDGDLTLARGFTAHVSYELTPETGGQSITVFDARVYIPAEKCRWEAGKCYTYVFKITDASTGTTDPNMIDPYYDDDKDGNPDVGADAEDDEPWIDPDDPRINTNPALAPIVFDGLLVSPYIEVSNNTNPDKIVSSYTWTNNNNTYYFLAAPTADQTTITGSNYVIVDPTSAIEQDHIYYNAADNKFELYDSKVESTGPAVGSKVVARFAATLYNSGTSAQAYFWSYNTGKAFRLWCNVYEPNYCEWDAEESYDGKAFAVYQQ